MQKLYLSLLLCTAVAGFANAADPRHESLELKRCLSTSNGSQGDAACYGEELTRLEKNLDELVLARKNIGVTIATIIAAMVQRW